MGDDSGIEAEHRGRCLGPLTPHPPGLLLCSCGQNGLCCFNYGGKKNTQYDVSTSSYVRSLFVVLVLCSIFILLGSFQPTVAHICPPLTQLNSDG